MASHPHGQEIRLGEQTDWASQENSIQYDLNTARNKFHTHVPSYRQYTLSNANEISLADLAGVRWQYHGFYSTTRTPYSNTVTWNNVNFGAGRKDRYVVCICKQDMGGTTTYATSGTIGGYSADCAAMGNKYYTGTTGLDTTGWNGSDRQWRQCHIMYRRLNTSSTSGTVTTTTLHNDAYTNACYMWVWTVYGPTDIKGFGASGFSTMGWNSGDSTSETSSRGYSNAYNHLYGRPPGLIVSVFGSERGNNTTGTPQRDWGLTNIVSPSTSFLQNHINGTELSGSTQSGGLGDEWTSGYGYHWYLNAPTYQHNMAYNAQDKSRTSSTTAWCVADFT